MEHFEKLRKIREERQKIRARKIRKWENAHTIILQKADLQDLKLKEGDYVDINKLRKVE